MEELLIRGDMIGDKLVIGEGHLARANAVIPHLASLTQNKIVIAVGGPSGSGKSEIASLIGTHFIRQGRMAYVLSCDNYPLLPPRDNEAKREKLYADLGDDGLRNYLGTPEEIDFGRINKIIADFKSGAKTIALRIMDNPGNKVSDNAKAVDFSNIQVLVLEGTWSHLIEGIDARIFLATNFEETIEHRKKRARDPLTPFGEKVLSFEQVKLDKIRENADYVITPEATVNVRAGR